MASTWSRTSGSSAETWCSCPDWVHGNDRGTKARRGPARTGRAWLGALLLALTALPGTVRAETTVNPMVVVKTEYDDNIQFTRDNQMDDLVTSLSPSVLLTHRTERLQSDTSALVRGLKYLEESDLDRVEALFETDLGYRYTERVSLQGNASYRLDSALETELQETGIVTEQSDRSRLSAGGGITFRLTELQEVGGSFSLGRTRYESDRFLDYDTVHLALNWTRTLQNQRDTLVLQPYWSHNSSDVSEVDSYGLMAGWNRALTESWTLSLFLGVRRTETEYQGTRPQLVFNPNLPRGGRFVVDTRTETLEESDWGAVAEAKVRWQGRTWAFGATYDRDLSYTARGETVERDRLVLSVRKRLNPRLSAHGRAWAVLSQYEGIDADEDFHHFNLSPSLSYRLTEDYVLTAGYSYGYYENRHLEDTGRDRNRVWVSLECSFPNLF